MLQRKTWLWRFGFCFLFWCCFELKTHRIGTVSNTHDSKAGCVGFVVVLPGKPMCIGCLSLGACLLVENYSMKTMESSVLFLRIALAGMRKRDTLSNIVAGAAFRECFAKWRKLHKSHTF